MSPIAPMNAFAKRSPRDMPETGRNGRKIETGCTPRYDVNSTMCLFTLGERTVVTIVFEETERP